MSEIDAGFVRVDRRNVINLVAQLLPDQGRRSRKSSLSVIHNEMGAVRGFIEDVDAACRELLRELDVVDLLLLSARGRYVVI